jgi:hypothetical protein
MQPFGEALRTPSVAIVFTCATRLDGFRDAQ